eukprot:386510_1
MSTGVLNRRVHDGGDDTFNAKKKRRKGRKISAPIATKTRTKIWSKCIGFLIIITLLIMLIYAINIGIPSGDMSFNSFILYYNISFNNNQDLMNKTNDIQMIDLLIIMIDDRIMLNDANINIKYDYYHHSFCINRLYANKYNYSLIVIDINDTKCEFPNYKQNQMVPIEWCKLEILKYYLFNKQFINKYKWLLYLDSDAHIINFDISSQQW